jgi:hypothetical protein
MTESAKTRTDRRTCAYCDASVAGCDAVSWLRGRLCCSSCTGNHDVEDRGRLNVTRPQASA